MALNYYDRAGQPITMSEWGETLTDENRRIAASDVGVSGGTVHVSTVWLGIDHSFGDGPPLIFETMAFGGSLNGQMVRYSTEAEAIAGHAAMYARVQAS